jgi:apolipoprotein N-acyltransferase
MTFCNPFKKMKKFSLYIIYSVVTGLLFSISWPSGGFAPLLFVAFVPLLIAEDKIASQDAGGEIKGRFFIWYSAFLVFNILTTWWVKFASFFGAVAAIVFNALFMALVFQLFHYTKRKLGSKIGYASLVFYWIAFEHFHMDWDLSWPWLTLGNGFAGWIKMIQWYEFTGVLGGTAWILIVNILLFQLLKFKNREHAIVRNKLIAGVLFLITVPVIYSFIRYYTYEEKSNPVNISIVQPNIDPYNEKFSGMSSADQLKRILSLAATVADSSTSYVVAPETALPDGIWEEELDDHPHVKLLKNFQHNFPHLNWVIGVASNLFYPDSTKRSVTARKFTQANGYYDSFNTAMQLEKNESLQLHHKSKLVPGVEKMPFPAVFKHLDAFAIDLGGMSGSLGVQESPAVFTDKMSGTIVAPVICYESIYGDYLSEYIRKGAQLIFIITNDGWWSDTPGYRQHLQYATLRAIESRRSIARSANTGISCFINQRGDILQRTGWWVPAAIKGTINKNSEITFYSRFGDVIGTIGFVVTIGILCCLCIKRI